MPWGVAIAAGGALLGSSMQAGAATSAASDQEQAALAQLGLSSAVFNAQGGMSLPTREAGGLAQSREAYLLGLSPDLDISADFSTPNIYTNPSSGQTSSSWNGPAAYDPSISGGGGSYGSYGSAVSGFSPSYSYPTGTSAPGAGAFSLAGGGYAMPGSTGGASPVSGYGAGTGMGGSAGTPNPNAGMPASSYGSYSTPYSPSTFFMSPDYSFIMGQGEQSVQNQAAATGQALSPATLAAAMQYSSGLATQDYNQAYTNSLQTQAQQFNMLNALSTGGQVSTSGLSTAASGLGTAGASALAGYGNAGAAGAVGAGNAYASGINGLTNASLYGLNAQNSAYNGGAGSLFDPNYSNEAAGGSGALYDGSGNIIGYQ